MTAVKYREEYDQKLIEHMSKGASFSTFSIEVNVTRDTLYKWVERYPSFKEAKARATEACLSFFEGILAAKISGQAVVGFDPKKSDTTLLIFALKTRFHKIYGDKKQLDVKHEGRIDSTVTKADYSKLSDKQIKTLIEISDAATAEE